jgi:hypothetical protein
MLPEHRDVGERSLGGAVLWERYIDTRQVRCTATQAAIDRLRSASGDQADAAPVDIFRLHRDKFAAAASKKMEANDYDEQGEIVVSAADIAKYQRG